MDEFELIRKLFSDRQKNRADVSFGIGDDAAVLNVPSRHQLLVSSDILNAGVHFPISTAPYNVGHKTAAVNLSDMAAMGAEPAWISLNLSLPAVDKSWIEEFSRGFFDLCNRFEVQLIGGDTTRGDLSICAQVFGFVPRGEALLRSGARAGDQIFVTGTLGDAALALRMMNQNRDAGDDTAYLRQRLEKPTPRVAIALLLRQHANAMIDLSDGLVADLGHILQASTVGAEVQLQQLPASAAFDRSLGDENRWSLAATSGDDYELCFTVAADKCEKIEEIRQQVNLPITRIGKITTGDRLLLLDADHKPLSLPSSGYMHFR